MAQVLDPQRHELAARVRRGLGWKLASQAPLQASRITVTIVLAHLLSPHEFGIAGMVLVLTAFVIPFADAGLGSALVQRPTIGESERSTMFWTCAAAGAAAAVLGVALSPLVARFYGEPAVEALLAVLSLDFLITSLGATHRALLLRGMDFRSLELRLLAGVVAGAGVGIAVALAGYGAWALVAQELVVTSVSTALLWVLMDWRPRFTFSRPALAELGSFGLRALVSDSLVRVNQNADNVLVGKFLGATPLGLYALAYNTMIMPLTRVVAPVQEVLYPAFSRLQTDSDAFRRLWLDATKAVCLLCLPVMFGLVVIAPDFVPAVIGAKWRSSAPVLQVLAVVGAVQCIQSQNSSVLRALDRTKTLLGYTIVSFVVNIAAFAIGLAWGILGVATAFALASLVLCVVFTGVVAGALETRPTVVAANVVGPVAAAALMGAACALTREALLRTQAPPLLRLAAVIGVGFVVFVPLAVLLNRNLAQRLRQLRTARRMSLAAD